MPLSAGDIVYVYVPSLMNPKYRVRRRRAHAAQAATVFLIATDKTALAPVAR